jgi:D-alanyl-D-alanine dipeptidase
MLTNLQIRRCILVAFILIFSTALSLYTYGQDSTLKIVKDWDEYEDQVRSDPDLRMVELRALIPGLQYELKYSGKDNFTRTRMYPEDLKETYLRLPAARALEKVQEELNQQGLGLKIFDAYRPYSVTVKFWDLIRDERYVAHPAKGSGHNRGIAVDLTIIDLSLGIELDMGTDFDNFTDTAHQDFSHLPAAVLGHRELLRSLMIKHGFRIYPEEWWHYFFPGGDKFDVLDLGFDKLKKKIRL